MNLKLFKNDLKKNPGSNLAMLLFLALSGAVTAAVVLMLVQLFSSISSLYETAQPPHFLQLHKGELAQEEIDAFNKDYPGVTDWQTVLMANFDGSELTVEGEPGFSLTDCRLDIGFVKQNESHDLLLDENRNKIQLQNGEIGVPAILSAQYPISLGDKIVLTCGEEQQVFTVAAFVHDAQMNSTMCSSTRFLVSDADFVRLFQNAEETEAIIETWFTDPSLAAAYQTAYEQALLPQNGQAVTYSMIFLLSAMTDIMTAMVVFLIGVLLIFIALLCMNYTMLAAFEEELAQIGTMKALGIPFGSIRGLYLGKMRFLMASGIFLGYVLAVLGAGPVTAHMNKTFGNQPLSHKALLLAALACLFIYIIFLQACKRILRRLKTVTVIDALVTRKGFRKERKVLDELHRERGLPVNLSIGLHVLKQSRREYAIVFLILLLTSFFVLVPHNLVDTMRAEDFVTYMGSGVHDAILEVEQGEDVELRWLALTRLLEQEKGVSFFSTRRVKIKAQDSEGCFLNMHVDTGAKSGVELRYLEGTAPQADDEIALSLLLAEQLGVRTNDSLPLMPSKDREVFTVCGIYQDVTSGGMTAKAVREFEQTAAEQYTIYVDMEAWLDREALISKWREQVGAGYAIELMEPFAEQTLGGVAGQIRNVSLAAFGIGAFLIILIVLLFLKLRIAGEAPQLAYKRALGIPLRDVKRQEFYPVLLAACAGVFFGMAMANLLGDRLAGFLLSFLGLGIKKLQFTLNPWTSWLLIPLFLLLTAAGAGSLAVRQIKKIEAADYGNVCE